MTENYVKIVEQSYTSVPKYSEKRAGLPEDYKDIRTIGDLLEINYKLVNVRDQLRQNLLYKMKTNEEKYPGIIGFEDKVIPSLDRAILAGHDVFLIGQIGQAKTKIVETIAEHLLSPIPIVQGSITNDCPFDLPQQELVSALEDSEVTEPHPKFYVSPETTEKIKDNKLSTPIEWKEGKDRYRYVLATPDISVKDFVGYIDAVKVAKKGMEMYKIESYSPGQLMQAKHGMFCIDELPVLDPRKQVALLSVLQEGRFTTGSFPVTFEPKTIFFATANPIDYTHSGKIIEPLYDRLKSHIPTHYPKSLEDEMRIILQESKISKSFIVLSMLKTLARLIQNARNSDEINQEKGVSVRLGIHGLELLVGESERTRSVHYSITPTPRLSDMHCLEQIAKFELLDIEDTLDNRRKIFNELITKSVKETCLEYFENIEPTVLESIKSEFSGKSFFISQKMIWQNSQSSYKTQLADFSNLNKLVVNTLEKFKNDQNNFQRILEKQNIDTSLIKLDDSRENELLSVITEIILEGLCWVEPKILNKKEGTYFVV